MKNNKIFLLALALFISHTAQATCVGLQNPPAGKPENFDINEHLKIFDSFGDAISDLPPGGVFGETITRASLMTSLFYSGRKYDLKNNTNMKSSQEFGNWFFGAAAAQIGYTKGEALRAGAVVQQWQNFGYDNHPSEGDLLVLTLELYRAVAFGDNDNEGDGPQISGGYDYGKDIYENDPNSSTNSNSCDESQPDSGNAGGGGGYGYGGGWGGGYFIGAGGCYGNCGGGYIIRTKITDLPPDTSEQ